MNKVVFKVLPLTLCGLLAVDTSFAETWSSLKPSATGSSTAPAVNSSVVSKSKMSSSSAQVLFSEIEVMKEQIQQLQDVIERQGYELNKLKTEQKERYLDLDRRISQAVAQPSVETTVSTRGGGDEQYTAAYGLMKAQKLDAAASSFKRFLQDFPKSALVVNGYYWLGQIYYNQGKLDDARKAFTIVVNQFPNHQKTADSMYKLGVVLHRLGDQRQGKEYLQLVVKQFASSATARFAQKYLQENYSK